MDRAIRNLVVVSDLHCGCALGLCTLDKVPRDEGGFYEPSEQQRKVAEWWREFWYDWVPHATKGEPFAVVVNGDALDGVHHKSTHQWSHNLEDQAELAYRTLAPIVEMCQGRYYHVRGTEAHVGQSGVEEERLAKRLGAVPNHVGNHARWELWIRLGDDDSEGASGLVHIMHHIGTTGSVAYESSGPHKELEQSLVHSALWANEIANVICRSHRHRYTKTEKFSYKGILTSVVTPGWQLKTPFAYKIPGGRHAEPEIGGIVIRAGDQDVFALPWLRSISRPEADAPTYSPEGIETPLTENKTCPAPRSRTKSGKQPYKTRKQQTRKGR